MLILTRRINEVLRVGENVKVTVLGIKGNQVRISIDAPRDTPVHREEIFRKIQREKVENDEPENLRDWVREASEEDFNR